jgi:hypothetical protein
MSTDRWEDLHEGFVKPSHYLNNPSFCRDNDAAQELVSA